MNKIEIFKQVRNIPYHIAIHGEAGSACADKSYKLIAELSKLGIEGRLIIGLIKWSDLNLPKEIEDVPHDDQSSHAFAGIKNDKGEWVFVDPTWNPELKKAGFPIAEWDGEGSTSLAIECYKIFSAEESVEYMKHVDNENDLKKNGKFYEAINKYCDSLLERNK